ncbi:MAG: hypothetical protein WC568_08115 [Candidatus Methanoperedens sp.]
MKTVQKVKEVKTEEVISGNDSWILESGFFFHDADIVDTVIVEYGYRKIYTVKNALKIG